MCYKYSLGNGILLFGCLQTRVHPADRVRVRAVSGTDSAKDGPLDLPRELDQDYPGNSVWEDLFMSDIPVTRAHSASDAGMLKRKGTPMLHASEFHSRKIISLNMTRLLRLLPASVPIRVHTSTPFAASQSPLSPLTTAVPPALPPRRRPPEGAGPLDRVYPQHAQDAHTCGGDGKDGQVDFRAPERPQGTFTRLTRLTPRRVSRLAPRRVSRRISRRVSRRLSRSMNPRDGAH